MSATASELLLQEIRSVTARSLANRRDPAQALATIGELLAKSGYPVSVTPAGRRLDALAPLWAEEDRPRLNRAS